MENNVINLDERLSSLDAKEEVVDDTTEGNQGQEDIVDDIIETPNEEVSDENIEIEEGTSAQTDSLPDTPDMGTDIKGEDIAKEEPKAYEFKDDFIKKAVEYYDMYGTLQPYLEVASKNFLAEHVEYLITHKSWWDTVDGLGSAAVSPLTDKYGCEKLIEKWNKSSNIWLNRAAIQHQRGRKFETDVKLILRYCHEHADSKEFFIVKAIGWALRDIAKISPREVRTFLRDHPDLGRVAVREAERGLGRS